MNFDELHEITFFEDAENAGANEKRAWSRKVHEKRVWSSADTSESSIFRTPETQICCFSSKKVLKYSKTLFFLRYVHTTFRTLRPRKFSAQFENFTCSFYWTSCNGEMYFKNYFKLWLRFWATCRARTVFSLVSAFLASSKKVISWSSSKFIKYLTIS